MKKRLQIALAFASIMIMVSPVACAPKPESITILSADSPSWILRFAKAQGYFRANGLDVTIDDSYSGGAAILNALANGEGDMAVTAEFPFVGLALRGASISIIANINKTVTVSLVGRKDRGIETAGDLKGKRIGLIRQAITEFYLGRFLDLNSLSISDVTLFNVANAESLEALKDGKVDAVADSPGFL